MSDKAMPHRTFVGLLNKQASAALTAGKQTWGRQMATLLERHALKLRAAYGGSNYWALRAVKRADLELIKKLCHIQPDATVVQVAEALEIDWKTL